MPVSGKRKKAKERTRETWSKAEIAELEMPDNSSLAQFMIDGYMLATATTFPSHRCLHIHVYMYACIWIQTHTCARVYVYTRIHVHVYMYARTD